MARARITREDLTAASGDPCDWFRYGHRLQLPLTGIVHHSAILEFDIPSYRIGAAQKHLQQEVCRQIRRSPGLGEPN